MTKFLLLILFVSNVFILSCTSSKNIADSKTIAFNNWQNAVINIESENDKYNINEILNYIKERKKLNKDYTKDDSLKDYNLLRYEVNKISGTAIYIEDGNNRYLITAKHVVYDKNYTSRHLFFTKENLQIRSHEYFEKLNSSISVKTPFSLFFKGKYNTFKIPDVNQDSATRPFKFSNDDLDIAIISLQSKMTYQLRELLETDGCKPISIKNIDTSDNHLVGEDIFAIGYPAFSTLGKILMQDKSINEDVVLPLTTFGKTALYSPSLYYFIADVTVNPGNSGGPIIRNNKIIGIASQQMLVDLKMNTSIDLKDIVSTLKYSSPLAKIVKSKYIIQMINELKKIESGKNFLKL
jgi:hypothetical protein